MASVPPPTAQQAFSALGLRLLALENRYEPIPDAISYGIAKLGSDYRLKKPRYTPTKTVANTSLPSGATISGNRLLVMPGASVIYEGWDFTGYNVDCRTGTATFRDCYFPNGLSCCLRVDGNATVFAEWCEFDGLRDPLNVFSLIFQPSDEASYLITDSTIHAGGNDCANMSSNSRLQRCYLHDMGYRPGSHPDLIQFSTGPGIHSNMAIVDCLLVGNSPEYVNNLIRGLAEKQPNKTAATIKDVLVSGNVGLMPADDLIHEPFAFGRRLLPATAEGMASLNHQMVDNWLMYSCPRVMATPPEPPTGQALWQNNRNLDTGELIAPPPGWSS